MANTPAAGGMNALAHASKKNFSSLNWRIGGGVVCLFACLLFILLFSHNFESSYCEPRVYKNQRVMSQKWRSNEMVRPETR